MLYGLLSNYGRSYLRPLLGLLVTFVAGAVEMLPRLGLTKCCLAVGLSFANTFSVLGFRKDLIDPHVIDGLSVALSVIAVLQTVAGIVFLFLFGLAIRNRFRIK
jgi:hypothetical protein